MTDAQAEKLVADFILHYREHYYRLAYHYVQNSADALDVVQDAVLKALASRTSLKDPTLIKPWFYRIVVHAAYDLLRKQKKWTVVDDKTLSSFDTGTMDEYEDLDLKMALEALPTPYRSVIVLRYFEDLKLEEVALVLDENVNTVKTRLYKALSLLRCNANVN